jgi:hypothetical protein
MICEWFYKRVRFNMVYLAQLRHTGSTPLYFTIFSKSPKGFSKMDKNKCPKSKRVLGLLQKTSIVTIMENYAVVFIKRTQNLLR